MYVCMVTFSYKRHNHDRRCRPEVWGTVTKVFRFSTLDEAPQAIDAQKEAMLAERTKQSGRKWVDHVVDYVRIDELVDFTDHDPSGDKRFAALSKEGARD